MKANFNLPLPVIEKAAELGYEPEKLPLLLLVPFIQVAWAEGFVQAGERRAIMRLAENFGVRPGHSDREQILEWFEERPSEKFFARSIGDLSRLLESLPVKQAARLRRMLQLGCFEVAHAAGDIGILRGGSNIRREEREQLRYIGEQLGLAHVSA